MARIRSVHPDICEDEALAGVSPYAERTFVRLWTQLDDEGRGKDNALLLKAQLYPLHEQMTPERVEKDLAELEAEGLLQRYEVDGIRYLCAKPEAWSRYQKPRHPSPSKIPKPPNNSGGPTAKRRRPHAGGEWSGVGVGGEEPAPQPAAAPGPPPPRCPQHTTTVGPVPPCGACADARRNHDTWRRQHPPESRDSRLDAQQQAARDAQQRHMAELEQRRAIPVDPAANVTNIAAVRAGLRGVPVHEGDT